MARYYVDTNIWRDSIESREDYLRPLDEFAYQFLKRAIERKDTILYSEVVVEELMIKYSLHEIESYCFQTLRQARLLEEAEISGRHIAEAERLSRRRKVPRADALHAVLARDNNAVLITRDRHFDSLQDIAYIRKPEEIT